MATPCHTPMNSMNRPNDKNVTKFLKMRIHPKLKVNIQLAGSQAWDGLLQGEFRSLGEAVRIPSQFCL
jgi:hypothetical protein